MKYEKGVQVIHPGRIREREREGNIKREGVSQQRVEGRSIVPTIQLVDFDQGFFLEDLLISVW